MITRRCDCGTDYGCFKTKFGEYHVVYIFDDVNIKACNRIAVNGDSVIYECFCGRDVVFQESANGTF